MLVCDLSREASGRAGGLRGQLEEAGCVADTQQEKVPPCQGREEAFQLASVLFLSNLTQISFLFKEEMAGCFVALKVRGRSETHLHATEVKETKPKLRNLGPQTLSPELQPSLASAPLS